MAKIKKTKQVNFFSVIGGLLFLLAALGCVYPLLWEIGEVLENISVIFDFEFDDLSWYWAWSSVVYAVNYAALGLSLLLMAIAMLRGRKGKMLSICAVWLAVQGVAAVVLRILLVVVARLLFPGGAVMYGIITARNGNVFQWLPPVVLAIFVLVICRAEKKRVWPKVLFLLPPFALLLCDLFGVNYISNLVSLVLFLFSVDTVESVIDWFASGTWYINELLRLYGIAAAYLALSIWLAFPKKKKEDPSEEPLCVEAYGAVVTEEELPQTETEPAVEDCEDFYVEPYVEPAPEETPVAEAIEEVPVTEIAPEDAPKVEPTETVRELVGVADEIRKYKELLDMGAISQEEFDLIKKRLLR